MEREGADIAVMGEGSTVDGSPIAGTAADDGSADADCEDLLHVGQAKFRSSVRPIQPQ